ncbi:glycogenin glucosyltransferase [Exophiala xenobiotica]
MAPIGRAVFATLLMNDAYLPGAMVLGHSLKDRGAKAPLVAFVTVDRLSADTINELRTVYDEIIPIQQITNKNPANLYLMNRPDLISTFTKIELWRQTQYKRIIYMDADMVALRAPNELLTLDTDFAAVPDIGWPDCFNTGLMVLTPNMADYYALLALAQRGISFDGADQGLLNMHFREWERLSFVYNCTPSGNYQYVPAYRHFQSSIAVVHFIGQDKPWTLGRENRFSTGVYGELMGMWWSVYDRHYRSNVSLSGPYEASLLTGRQTITHYDPRTYASAKKVQDYVHGEQPIYAPSYSSHAATGSPAQHGQIPLPSEITIPGSASGHPVKVEMPLGDAPTPAMRSDFAPVSTTQQRRFSAPHVEWEPMRAPPPTDSKPEAANFPIVTYDMSSDTQLFQPPTQYPEAPRDMWYQLPEKAREPVKPKQIFPWEARAPKATRVFPKTKSPSPPPLPLDEPMSDLEQEEVATPSAATDATDITEESVLTPTQRESINPWESFQQRTNAWDDMPEIERYVRAFNQSRKGKLQVLHHTPPQRSPGGTAINSPSADPQRRPSLRLTDFPTEFERPSLPVTPAPIRRATIWGEERDEETLPAAEGVPKQEEWVRRFSSYSAPVFAAALPAPLVHDLPHAFYWRCQYCGKQNPVTKLEELQRRQSELLMSPTGSRQLGETDELPQRQMPESRSKEDVIEKAELSMSPTKTPKVPKPILKAPHFELGQGVDEPAEKEDIPSPTSTRPPISQAASL